MATERSTTKTATERQKHIDRLRHELDQWGDELAELETRLRAKGAHARSAVLERFDALRREYAAGVAALERLSEATDERWAHVSGEAEYAWKALHRSFNYFRAQFRDSVRSGRPSDTER